MKITKNVSIMKLKPMWTKNDRIGKPIGRTDIALLQLMDNEFFVNVFVGTEGTLDIQAFLYKNANEEEAFTQPAAEPTPMDVMYIQELVAEWMKANKDYCDAQRAWMSAK